MRKAFTLVELLVVLGIVVLLVGLLLPMLMRSKAAAREARIQAELATVATALTAYKQDFGDFPRIPPVDPPNPTGEYREPWVILAPGNDPLMNELGDPKYIYGSEILTWALIGPYPATGSGFTPGDGANGPGWRESRRGGRVVSPYLNLDNFKFGVSKTAPRYQVLFDMNQQPVLYMPAGQRDAATDPNRGYLRRSSTALWDFRYIDPAFSTTGNDSAARLANVQAILGDKNSNGYIDNGESTVQGSFMLWSAGADEQYGTDDDARIEQ